MRRRLSRRPAAWTPPGVIASIALVASCLCAFTQAVVVPRSAHASSSDEEGAAVGRAAEERRTRADTTRVYGPFDTIEVVSRPPDRAERIERLPTFAAIRNLDYATERVATIADVLDETVGVRVRRYGGLGAFATASIRGSSPGQVEVYLDGVPLNSAQSGITNLADIAIDNLSHLEVYRSGAPLEFGTPGIGGVVNLVSRPAGARRTILSVSEGSYGTWKTSLLHSGKAAGFDHLVSYRHLQTRGDFRFLYDPGTPVINEEDDEVLTRRNNDFREHALLLKVVSPRVAGWRFDLRDDWFLKESGLPGHGNLLYQQASFDNRRHVATIGARSPFLLDHRLRAEAGAFTLYQRDRYRNPAGEPGLNPTDLEHRTRGDGVNVRFTTYLPEARQTIGVRGEWRRETFVPIDAAPRVGKGFERERRRIDLGAEDELALWADRLILIGSYRYQEARDNYFGPLPFGRPPEERDPHWSTFHGPSFGARFALDGNVVLKANRTRYARFPTFFELFGTGGEVRTSPELAPESGTTWDAGVRWDLPERSLLRGSVEVSAYRSERDSIIYFIQNSQRNFRALNLEHVTAEGLEVQWDLRAPAPFVSDLALRAEGNVTWQDARHEGTVALWDGKQLPYVSPRELFLRTSIDLRRYALRHEYRFFDRYYVDRANTEEDRAAAKRLHNLGVTGRFWQRRLTLDLTLENAFDVKLEDAFGYPMPGRTFYLTLELDLGAREGAGRVQP